MVFDFMLDLVSVAFEQFGLLVGQNGAYPKGYILVNGKYVTPN